MLASLWLTACGGAEADETNARPAGTPIRITFGDTELSARLDDSATARELSGRLSLTLSFRDHNSAEKTAPLPGKLPTRGAPAGHDPAAGDIGCYAPAGDLVLYDDDSAPYFEGIVRIGRIEDDVEALRRQPDGFEATVRK